jgi:divalent metal cation (Fe/Co/Zn/Cd) transporter
VTGRSDSRYSLGSCPVKVKTLHQPRGGLPDAAECRTLLADMSMQIRADQERRVVARHGRRLQYLTIAWNSVECLISIGAGFVAGSIALIGFGFDSAIEVASSLAALWRLARDEDEAARERAERRTLRIIGVCFMALAMYVAVDGIQALINRESPAASAVGIVIAALSLVVMPALVRFKRRVATQLNSGALEAETRQTAVCAFLSAILLTGLGLNARLGWWWADPLAGLAMVPLIAQEGIEALRGETYCQH